MAESRSLFGFEFKRKSIAEIVDKINKNNFSKFDFNNLAKDENVEVWFLDTEQRRRDSSRDSSTHAAPAAGCTSPD